MAVDFLQFGRRERRRGGGFGVLGRPERAAGSCGAGEQPGLDQPLQGLISRTVDDFQAHRS